MRKNSFWMIIIVGMIVFIPAYSQNVVNISLSTQEMQNGITLFNQRRYTAAIQAFELSLSYEPLNHAAKYRLGLAYLYAGYAQNAIHIWEELVRLGVADYQVIEQLNHLYFKMALDEGYDYENPYIFREYYDGFLQGGYDIFRTSFVEYDNERDLKYVSSIGKKQVVVLDNANNIISKYGARLFLPNILEMPMGIAIYSNFLYVADYKKNKIFVFNRDNFGTLATSFGETGSLPSQLSGPMGITVSQDEYLYIVDNGNSRIQKFLPDGTHIYNFGDRYLYRPTDIVVKDDIVYVTDIDKNKNGRLVLFDSSGNFITNIGEQFLKEPRGLFLEDNDLYISDTFGYVYLYNIANKTTSTFLEGSKLVSPFDLMKDKDKILWRTDFNSEKIAIYTPLQGVYGNIELNISQVLTDQYPYVYAVVRARNKDGSPVTGLIKEEISVTEFDLPVRDLLVSGTQMHRDKMKLSIIIDKSISAGNYTPQLEYYLKTFLSNTTGNDLMETILVDDMAYHSGMQTASVSKAWDFITNYQSKAEVPQSWDVPIYDSITSLLNNFRNRAIIIFTAGEGKREAFSEYNMDVVKTYASQNNIPIYIINFGNKNSELWSQLAKESLGRYFEANQHAGEILNLYSIINNAPPLEYLIEYKAYNYSDVPDLWVEINLNLERFGVSGVTTGGYYVPRPSSSPINLQESFFQ
ncbi:MAG: hypothetical protein ACRC0X_01455 [Brevinema sp.]